MSDVATSMQIDDQRRAQKLVEACRKVREQVARVVVGQEEVVEQLLIAILARGHCLLEGVPGLAKASMGPSPFSDGNSSSRNSNATRGL